MCLSAVYEVKNGDERLICEHVSGIVAEEGRVRLTDIMGEETVLLGAVKTIDLVKNIIKVEI